MTKHKVPIGKVIPPRVKGERPGYINEKVIDGPKGDLNNLGNESGGVYPALIQKDDSNGACGSSPWKSE